MSRLPDGLPETGLGDAAASELLLSLADKGAANLAAPDALAHMDPPAAGVAAAILHQVAGANQNLLHPATSPFASEAEALVLGWIAPVFGMAWGQMCSGSTIANLTALWAAREAGATCVVASADAHISVPKSAHVLGMDYVAVPVDAAGRLDRDRLPDVANAALVLTAGTTGRGVIDEITAVSPCWLHVDAAWAGPLRFTRYAARLDGIEAANSVAISAHKWLYQPKGAALALFRDEDAKAAISFQSSYLARPNVGVEGSRGATAIPLLATLLAWGRQGLADRIQASMVLSEALAARLDADPRTALKQAPETGVVNWRPLLGDTARVVDQLSGTSSSVMIDGDMWVRQVAANPDADLDAIWARIDGALQVSS